MNLDKVIDEYLSKADWRVKENSNTNYSNPGLQGHLAQTAVAHYSLNNMYKGKIAEAHKKCFIHVHDLGNALIGYCAGWSIEDLLRKGFNCDGRFIWSDPPKHLDAVCGQINNFIFTMAGEWAGAQALNSVDTFLAPFVKEDKLSYRQVKKTLQQLIYNLNVKTRVQMQAPFSNFSFDITVPKDLQSRKVIIGGKELDYTYGDCQKEMDIINKAFIEAMIEGDRKGSPFTFPIPTYNITKNFPWGSETAKNIFTFCDEIGTPYLQNFINSDLNPEDIRSMCCRLQLDKRQLIKNTGGIFGSGDYTGSLGVVTLNLSRIGFMSRQIAYNGKEYKTILKPFDDLQNTIEELKDKYKEHELMTSIFFAMISYFMDLAKESLVIKRSVVQENYEKNMTPYTNRYLEGFWNHFNTIGVNAGQECCLNMFGYGIDNPKGNEFIQETLKFMLSKLQDYQEEHKDYYKDMGKGLLWNLEATPAEGTGTRFAIHDLREFNEEIITANGLQLEYYTNSTQLPQDFTDNIYEVFDNQNTIQPLYTSGTVQHIYLNEPVHSWEVVESLVKKIFTNYKLPYVSIAPNLCVCPICGRLYKTYEYCPNNHTEEQLKEAIRRGAKVINE